MDRQTLLPRDAMPGIGPWRIEHPLAETLIYRGAALDQDIRFMTLAQAIGSLPVVVAGDHTSKSCALAVARFDVGEVTFLVRDNFYDLNLAVFAPRLPVEVPLETFYQTHDWAWYLGQIARSEGYSWRGWTPEEIADPRIGRVQVKAQHGSNTYWSEKKWDEKERWQRRMTDPAWHGRDWSDPLVVVGEMGPGCSFAVITKAFAQGMPVDLLPYPQDRHQFIVTTSWDLVEGQMRAVLEDREAGTAEGRAETIHLAGG